MLTIALSNTSCCSTRKVTEQSRTEATAAVGATEHGTSRHEEKRETIQRETLGGVTLTEIEIFDTTQPKDPATGDPPVKVRVKQRRDENGEIWAVERAATTDSDESDMTLEYEGGELEELEVTACKPPSLWERAKDASRVLAAIIIPVIAGWIIYKRKKR